MRNNQKATAKLQGAIWMCISEIMDFDSEKQELTREFKLADKNQDGRINQEELKDGFLQ